MADYGLFTLNRPYHDWLRPCDAKSQGIISHGMDILFRQSPAPTTKGLTIKVPVCYPYATQIDSLAPIGARPSAGTVLTEQIDMFSSKISDNQLLRLNKIDRMMLFKIRSHNLAALRMSILKM